MADERTFKKSHEGAISNFQAAVGIKKRMTRQPTLGWKKQRRSGDQIMPLRRQVQRVYRQSR
jgi:hypothetical protein